MGSAAVGGVVVVASLPDSITFTLFATSFDTSFASLSVTSLSGDGGCGASGSGPERLFL